MDGSDSDTTRPPCTGRLRRDAVLNRLAKVEIFAFGPVGYAGVTSTGETDFKRILSQPPSVALVAFETLYTTGKAQAKCYALTGIRKLDPKRFKELLKTIQNSKAKVLTQSGCIIFHETLGDITKRIAEGKGTAGKVLTAPLGNFCLNAPGSL